MRPSLSAFASLAILLSGKAVATTIYGQCGGIGFTGDTSCTTTGTVCVYQNDWYSQCLPGTASTTSTTTSSSTSTSSTSSSTSTSSTSTSSTSKSTMSTSATSTTPTSSTSTSTAPPASASTNSVGCVGPLTKFKYFGVNESGAEFGTNIPGVLGTDYTWPSPSSIDYFVGLGFNTFRVPFMMERLSPVANGLTGAFDATYLSGLTTIVNYITNKGGYVLIDPHNYMRYNGAIITSTSDFATWWANLASQFKTNSHVIFDLQNEPYDIDASVVFSLMQAAINSIRAAGATSQLILVEGTSWTGAWSWTTSGNSAVFGAITDPYNNVAIEMHQYLDSDSSGSSATCVSSTVGAERLAAATAWLEANNLKGFLGEIGAGSNTVCIEAVQSALCSMQQSDVWIGALWWAAGPWWGTYFQSIEPPSGAAIPSILPQALEPFL